VQCQSQRSQFQNRESAWNMLKARLYEIELKKREELLEQVVSWGYSRIPIYEENLDHIKGVLYSKDLLPHLEAKADFKWIELIRPAYFVPEYKKINDLLEDFQSKNIHLAIVVDEYGGTCGLISLDDILEEIVGEISDESDFD
jgi:CBS domain containing-hemolysin-like protein